MQIYRPPQEIQDFLKENDQKSKAYFKAINEFLSKQLGEDIKIKHFDPAYCWFGLGNYWKPTQEYMRKEKRGGNPGFRPLAKFPEGRAMREAWFEFSKSLEKPVVGFDKYEKITGSPMFTGYQIQEVEGEYLLTSYEGWEPEKMGYTAVEITAAKPAEATT